jgi:hypothetical protein
LRLKAGGSETPLIGALRAGFDFHVEEPFQCGRYAEILGGASVRVVSSWRLMVDKLSWFSFCSRGVIGFLSRFEDEGVIFKQRKRIGDEFVEQRIA